MSNTNASGNNVESLQHMERAIKNLERKKSNQRPLTPRQIKKLIE